LVSYSVQVDADKPEFSYFTDIEFSKLLRERMSKATLLVGFNIKFDLHWARHLGVLPPTGVRIWDCQIAEFIIRGQQGSYPSLNEALARFDLGQKDDKVAEYWALGINTQDIPLDELRFYNDLDVELTYKLYLKQQEVMDAKLKRLCTIMGLDLLVLEDMEWNGVKIDVEECKARAVTTAAEVKTLTAELRNIFDVPDDVNLDSGHQLSCLLYGGAFELVRVSSVDKLIYKSGPRKGQEYERNRYETVVLERERIFTPLKGSETKLVSKVEGRESPVFATGEDVLKQLSAVSKSRKRIIELLLQRAEQAKLLDTYYGALPELLEKMQWGDTLHGQFNQVVARTGRLSSSNPNQQNFSAEVDQLLVSRYA
jgi:DNA polymerase I-like protein with 3'-5' exonuclease and polymerase domains